MSMREEKKKIEPIDPIDFKVDEWKYEFPFKVLDDTPGGSNLGRIQWYVEMHPMPKKRGRKNIKEIWVWARQTRDERYANKIFRIETWAEGLTTNSLKESFSPWRIFFCEEHKGAVVLDAYPKNHHTKLVICPFSSISCEVDFD